MLSSGFILSVCQLWFNRCNYRIVQIEKLQNILDNPEWFDIKEPLPLPLDPNVKITGVVAGKWPGTELLKSLNVYKGLFL